MAVADWRPHLRSKTSQLVLLLLTIAAFAGALSIKASEIFPKGNPMKADSAAETPLLSLSRLVIAPEWRRRQWPARLKLSRTKLRPPLIMANDEVTNDHQQQQHHEPLESPQARMKRSTLHLRQLSEEPQVALGAATSNKVMIASAGTGIQQPLNKQQKAQEQAFQRRLMELKQKYMTNRAISDRAYYTLLVIYSLFILVGTISNSLICLTVILKPKILSPRNIFIVNLAGSDLLLCVFTMPFSFIEISMKMWQMGLIPCKLVAGLQATSIFVSTISITAIALDRYKVIVYPTHQETANGTRSAALLLASVWIGALLLSLPLFSFRTVEHLDLPHKYDTIKSIDFCVEAWPFAHGRGIYSVISMMFQYVLPITIVSVVYVKISDKLQKRLIRRQRLTQLECQQKKQLNLIRRTHTMLISVSLIFGLSWLPLNLLNVIGDFSDLFRGDDQLFRIVFAICHLIGCSSACSNPILYGFLNENFRKEFHQVYTHHAHRLVRLMRRLNVLCCGGKNDNYMPSTPTSSSLYSDSSSSSKSSPSNSSRASSSALNSSSSSSRTESSQTSASPGAAVAALASLSTTSSNELKNLDSNTNVTEHRIGETENNNSNNIKQEKIVDQVSRRFSLQNLTTSRQTLDKTMRLCLCFQATDLQSSSETLPEQQAANQDSVAKSKLETTQRKYKRNEIELKSMRLSETDSQAMSRQKGKSRKRRHKRKRTKECLCRCHSGGNHRIVRVSQKSNLNSFNNKTQAGRQTSSIIMGTENAGKRVWLRFFPASAKERYYKVSGVNRRASKAARKGDLIEPVASVNANGVSAEGHNEVGQPEVGAQQAPISSKQDLKFKQRHCSDCKKDAEVRKRRRKLERRKRGELRIASGSGEPSKEARKRKRKGEKKKMRRHNKSFIGNPMSHPAVEGLPMSVSNSCKFNASISNATTTKSNAEDDKVKQDGRGEERLSKDLHVIELSGGAESCDKKSRITGNYYLSVETARCSKQRRKQSLEFSTSKERSTSVLFLEAVDGLDSSSIVDFSVSNDNHNSDHSSRVKVADIKLAAGEYESDELHKSNSKSVTNIAGTNVIKSNEFRTTSPIKVSTSAVTSSPTCQSSEFAPMLSEFNNNNNNNRMSSDHDIAKGFRSRNGPAEDEEEEEGQANEVEHLSSTPTIEAVKIYKRQQSRDTSSLNREQSTSATKVSQSAQIQASNSNSSSYVCLTHSSSSSICTCSTTSSNSASSSSNSSSSCHHLAYQESHSNEAGVPNSVKSRTVSSSLAALAGSILQVSNPASITCDPGQSSSVASSLTCSSSESRGSNLSEFACSSASSWHSMAYGQHQQQQIASGVNTTNKMLRRMSTVSYGGPVSHLMSTIDESVKGCNGYIEKTRPEYSNSQQQRSSTSKHLTMTEPVDKLINNENVRGEVMEGKRERVNGGRVTSIKRTK